jgi:hypothetical protein
LDRVHDVPREPRRVVADDQVERSGRTPTLRRRVDTLRAEARALEASLTGTQRAELGRARACPAPSPAPAPRGRRRADEGPRCPVLHGDAAFDGVAHPRYTQEA